MSHQRRNPAVPARNPSFTGRIGSASWARMGLRVGVGERLKFTGIPEMAAPPRVKTPDPATAE